MQQELFDDLFTKENIAQYSAFLRGKKYPTSDYFPRTCPLPVDSYQMYTATVNASMPTDWGEPTAFSQTPSRKPTGYYLSPGSIGKIKVPEIMVNAGFKILDIKYRPADGGKVKFPHTLNGSGLGLPRALIAVMENYQKADGSIVVPRSSAPVDGRH